MSDLKRTKPTDIPTPSWNVRSCWQMLAWEPFNSEARCQTKVLRDWHSGKLIEIIRYFKIKINGWDFYFLFGFFFLSFLIYPLLLPLFHSLLLGPFIFFSTSEPPLNLQPKNINKTSTLWTIALRWQPTTHFAFTNNGSGILFFSLLTCKSPWDCV